MDSVGGARHMLHMLKTPCPLMTPQKREDSSGWLVIVSWPGGPEERVNGFRSLADVTSWLANGAQEWLQKQPRGKNVQSL